MSVWDTYESRSKSYGGSKYGAMFERKRRAIMNKLPDNLSYELVDVFSSEHCINIDSEEAQKNKIEQHIAVIDSDNLNEKYIYTMPDEDIDLGSLVALDGSYWLVDERDSRTVLYTRARILQCNHLLKWIQDGEIMTQWCVIEDGTKYMTGELEDRQFIVTRGDSRIAMMIAKNKHTVRFNRECRFLIDDEESPHKLSYILTKPLKVGLSYGGKGVFKFVLQESTATGDDNHELGIADYYKHFDKDGDKRLTAKDEEADNTGDTQISDNNSDIERKRVWF